MFQRGELGNKSIYTGEPTRTECHDYGAQHPELGSVSSSTTSLRHQPTIPAGCCKMSMPCDVDEPGHIAGDLWREAALTPLGGRIGCYLKQIKRPTPDPIIPPVDPDPIIVSPVTSTRRCYLLIIDVSIQVITPATCPVNP